MDLPKKAPPRRRLARLKALLVAAADPPDADVGEVIHREFPPLRNVAAFAAILKDDGVPHKAVMLTLRVLRDIGEKDAAQRESAARAIYVFVADEGRHFNDRVQAMLYLAPLSLGLAELITEERAPLLAEIARHERKRQEDALPSAPPERRS
jgi:hypothetical protein